MAYGDNRHKLRGIEKEAGIMDGAIHSLRKRGHLSAKAVKSTLNENMVDKIDYKLDFGKDMFKGHFYAAVDIKSGWSYTLITTTGVNTIEKSKALYLIYEFSESDDTYAFINVPRLRELLRKHPPKLRRSKFNSSMYFSMSDYVYEHMEELIPDDYFELLK